jgi:hypothetical protein
MSKFSPGSREDVIRHLQDLHGWNDRDDDDRARYSLVTADGVHIITTAELLAIHRELVLLEGKVN